MASSIEYVLDDVWPSQPPAADRLDPQALDEAPDGTLYVLDAARGQVRILARDGALVRIWTPSVPGATVAQFSGLAIDGSRGRVYIGELQPTPRLHRFRLLDGSYETSWVAGLGVEGTLMQPVDITVSASGDVYVASEETLRVDWFADTGTHLGTFNFCGSPRDRLRAPIAVTTDPVTGDVFVGDNGPARVCRLNSTGAPVAVWELDGPAPPTVGQPFSILFDLEFEPTSRRLLAALNIPGQVAYVSATSITPRLRSVDLPGGAGGQFDRPRALALRADGSLAVGGLNADDSRVVIQFDPSDAVAAISSDSVSTTGFATPRGLTVDVTGRVYVLDWLARTVSIHQPDGSAVEQRNTLLSPLDIATGRAGELVVVYNLAESGVSSVPGFGGVARISSVPHVEWLRACNCSIRARAGAGDTLAYVTDAESRALQQFDLGTGAYSAGPSLNTLLWPADAAVGAGGTIFTADLVDRRIESWSSAGAQVTAWGVGAGVGPIRVAAQPGGDGRVIVLNGDGRAQVYSADGNLLADWTPQPVAGQSQVNALDVAIALDGTVYIADGVSRSVLVYKPRAAAQPTPTAGLGTPSPGICTLTGDKTANPTTVMVNDPVQVTLTLSGSCPGAVAPAADVVLVIDRSGSMQQNNKLDDAKAAASDFVRGVDLTRHRVGLVTFGDLATVDHPLTNNSNSMLNAIAAVQIVASQRSTNLQDGIDRATQLLTTTGRPDALGVIVLLTDGRPTRPTPDPYVATVMAAQRAHAELIQVFSIGLGPDVDADVIRAMASTPDDAFFAPTGADLQEIYNRLSREVQALGITELSIIDTLWRDVNLVPNSPVPSANVVGRVLTWGRPFMPAGGIQLTYTIRPQVPGTYPANEQAIALYTDADGSRRVFVFPRPILIVLGPTPTPTATLVPRPTPTGGPSTPNLCRAGAACGTLAMRVFYDARCDRFYNPGPDYPLTNARVVIRTATGTIEVTVGTAPGGAIAAFVPIGPVDVDVTYPATFQGMPISACPSSPTHYSLDAPDFGRFGYVYLSFRANVTR
jgi:uncharacterized protein YegL